MIQNQINKNYAFIENKNTHLNYLIKKNKIKSKIYRINSGKEKWLDYDRIMPIIKNADFNGWMSVVYEGQDELNEIQAVPKASKFLRDMLNTYGL